MLLAASKGDKVDAMTESRQRMPVMRSRRQSGQLSGSRGSSLGCGTRMVPSLLRLRTASCGRPAGVSVRSLRVEVPVALAC